MSSQTLVGRSTSMWQKIVLAITILVAFIAYDISRLRVPDEAKDTLPMRRFMYGKRLVDIKVYTVNRSKDVMICRKPLGLIRDDSDNTVFACCIKCQLFSNLKDPPHPANLLKQI